MAEKSKPNLPLKVEAFWNPAEAQLELKMELLPTSELSHHQIAAMFDDGVSSSVLSSNVHDVLKVSVTLKHTKDVAAAGKVEHDLHHEARNANMSVPAFRIKKAADEKKVAATKAAADKAAKKAAKSEEPND